MRKLSFALISLFLILYSLFIPGSAFGQNQDALFLGIFPPILEINADPPAKIESNISVSNLNDNVQNLKIIFKSFKLSPEGNGTITYLTGNSIEGPDPLILQKVKVYDGGNAINGLLLEPLETKELKLKISLEENAPIGDYYFSVIFVSSPSDSKETSRVQVPGGIGTNVILSVGKKGETRGEIKEFSVPALVGSGPLPITLLLRNNSNHYVTPRGKITIKNMIGGTAGRIDILPQYILANSQRYMIDANQASPSANFSSTVTRLSKKNRVIVWPEKFLFGFYTVTASIKLSDEGPAFETSAHFVALPLYTIFVTSFFAFVLLGIYLKIKRKI